MIFADGMQLYHQFFPSDFHFVLDRVSQDAQEVADWARSNGLTLNSGKTKVIGSETFTRELYLTTISRAVIDGCSLVYAIEARSVTKTSSSTLTTGKRMRCLSLEGSSPHSTPCASSAMPCRETLGSILLRLVFPQFD